MDAKMIISSQKFLDLDIVDEKIAILEGKQSVTLPVVHAGEYDGQTVLVLVDGHHRLAAAKELGLEIIFAEQPRADYNWDNEWTLDQALEANYLDSDWYDVTTGQLAF